MNKMTVDYFKPLEQAIKGYFNSDPGLQQDSRRIFHGRGGCYPELQWCVVDVFAPALLVTLFEPPPEGFDEALLKLIESQRAFSESGRFNRLAVQHRYQPDAPCVWLIGEDLEEATARRGILNFHIRFNRKNVGFFLDMEPGRAWLQERAAGKSVLNLFAFTCAFSVVAQAAGAKKIVNVDMNSRALTIGRRNHQLNNQSTDNVQFMDLDILKSWSRIRKPGPYDIIIIDPPSYQKGSFVATKDYLKVIRRIAEFACPGADIMACLNAPELGVQFLIDLFAEHSPECKYRGRLPWSPDFRDIDEQRQLKLLHFTYE